LRKKEIQYNTHHAIRNMKYEIRDYAFSMFLLSSSSANAVEALYGI
jgi:hypothetical protein